MVFLIRTPPLIKKPLLWPILRFGLSEIFEMDLSFPFGNHRFWLQNRSKSVQKCSTFSPAVPKSSKTRFWVCISYINRLKSALKASKILGDFRLLIRTPPLFWQYLEQGGVSYYNYHWYGNLYHTFITKVWFFKTVFSDFWEFDLPCLGLEGRR